MRTLRAGHRELVAKGEALSFRVIDAASAGADGGAEQLHVNVQVWDHCRPATSGEVQLAIARRALPAAAADDVGRPRRRTPERLVGVEDAAARARREPQAPRSARDRAASAPRHPFRPTGASRPADARRRLLRG